MLILYSDKTFYKKKDFYPLYITLGNLPLSYLKLKSVKLLIGLMPIIKFPVNNWRSMAQHRVIMQKMWELALSKTMTARTEGRIYEHISPEQRVFPTIYLYYADLPEISFVTATKKPYFTTTTATTTTTTTNTSATTNNTSEEYMTLDNNDDNSEDSSD